MPRPTTRTEKEIYRTVKFHDSPICKRINAMINEKNLKDFCEKINVTERTVYHWRKGQSRPDIDRLGAIADYFNVTVDYLCGRVDVPAPTMKVTEFCEYTGLSESTLMWLKNIKEISDNDSTSSLKLIEVFECIIKNSAFLPLLQKTRDYLHYKAIYDENMILPILPSWIKTLEDNFLFNQYKAKLHFETCIDEMATNYSNDFIGGKYDGEESEWHDKLRGWINLQEEMDNDA